MYLKRIEIQGFKSFANKTVLEFSESSYKNKNARSVTAIVGPNGSGKSNISDSIRWVLGEQSIKALRGKKTDDVIFAGSEKKARVGFAEVSLYLDNTDQKAPIEYTELVITRRVYRDGEGEYLINKNKVRLFDILMLLAKANFGQKTYSIVGQGMVDQIINISPWERKEFFDEATGVKQYQIKRDQSVSRLTKSKSNLLETNKIIAELEPRLRLLTKQIKKLEKRQEIEVQLKDLQSKYYANIFDRLRNDRTHFEEEFAIKDGLRQELNDRLMQVQAKLAELAREESRKEVFNNLQKEYNKLLTEKSELMKELSIVRGKMSLEYVKSGKQNLSWLEDKREEIGNRLSEIKESKQNLENKLNHQREQLQEKSDKVNEQTQELIILQNNLRSAEEELARLRSGRHDYALESVKAILRQKDYIKGICGTVGSLAKTEKMYETALAVVASSRLNAIVVQNDEVAVKCIAFLKQNQLPPAMFFPLNNLKVYSSKEDPNILAANGAIGQAVNLLTFDPKFQKVYELVFGSTVVVDTIENAKNIGVGREKMVTLEGDLFDKSGIIRGGFRRAGSVSWTTVGDNGQASSAEKMGQITILKTKIDDLNHRREVLSHEINDWRVEVQVAETKLKGLINDFDTLAHEKEKIETEIKENEIDPADQDKFLKELDKRRKTMEKQQEQLETAGDELRKKIDAFNLEEEKKKNEVFRLQDEMQTYQQKLNVAVQETNDIKVSLGKLEAKYEDLDKEVRQELGVEVKLEDLKAEAVINPDQLWFEIGKLKQNLDLIGGIDPEIVGEHKEVSERYEFLSQQTGDLERAIKDLEKIVGELDIVIRKQFDSSFTKINHAFELYFKKIFEGGKAKLTLVQKEKFEKDNETTTEADKALAEGQAEAVASEEIEVKEKSNDYIQTGVDIYVSPPNKKLTTISALSGGERTMTSLALLCAIIECNPAPFVVMDEVEAALDEANSERFAAILNELSLKTQFVIITHNRVIMHVADVLYGVAMGEDGVSKTLSLDVQEAEKNIEKAKK